ncbi:MAG TPA: hypothetical protein VGR73_19560 [Bryobacteraceae bacterium]|nr:hypothetical protein [Bryobacteraceae bacterium]
MEMQTGQTSITLPASTKIPRAERFSIQPVGCSALAEVAGFLHRQLGQRAERPSFSNPQREDRPNIERRLRWFLLGNPLTRDDPRHGFCIRDSSGVIQGLTLCFPGAFLAGDRRLLGLGSGSFFVEPQARTAGFYLFKKYLGSPGYAFFFATTCNASSAALWGQLGGCPVPNYTPEYILPLKLDALLPALVAGTALNGTAPAIVRMLGRCANPILQFFERRSGELAIAPCQDWRKLSDLFYRCRPKDYFTTDRSVEFLQWRYGGSAGLYPSEVYMFRDNRGNEGWFSLGTMARGRLGQIRASVLLDAIWPREKIRFSDILPGIVQVAVAQADALFLRPRPGIDCGESSRWIIRRRRAPANAFAITRKGDSPLAVASLDLVPADGDGALPVLPGVVQRAT